jgi:alpha-beta hydrolase superfamily lysophospholipase
MEFLRHCFSQPPISQRNGPTPPRRSRHDQRTRDNTPIAFDVFGVGEPTLILVHGWGCDARYWRQQLAHFSARHRVVTADLAGHGHSGAGREDYTMRSFSEDVRAVADAVGGDQGTKGVMTFYWGITLPRYRPFFAAEIEKRNTQKWPKT